MRKRETGDFELRGQGRVAVRYQHLETGGGHGMRQHQNVIGQSADPQFLGKQHDPHVGASAAASREGRGARDSLLACWREGSLNRPMDSSSTSTKCVFSLSSMSTDAKTI